MFESKTRQGGIALIEVVVAVVIFALGGLAAATLHLSSTKANQAASNRQIGANLARQLLEAVEALPYGHADLNPTGGGFVNPPSALSGANPLNSYGQDTGAGRFFTRTWSIAETGTGLPDAVNYKTISVQVTWNQAGRQEQIVMNTIKGW